MVCKDVLVGICGMVSDYFSITLITDVQCF